MKTEQMKISRVRLNTDNPRTISKEKFEKLIDSILIFPKMLVVRPIVVDEGNIALGGNMRLRALQEIAKMDADGIKQRLEGVNDYQRKGEPERFAIVSYWTDWLKSPHAEVAKAADLTEDEKKQFIIKDNVAFGQWDWDILANKWDNTQLSDWGMDVWNNGSDTNVDNLFEEIETKEDGGIGKSVTIVVSFSESLGYDTQEITGKIREALSEYADITVR